MKVLLFNRDRKPWLNPVVEIPDFSKFPPVINDGGMIFLHRDLGFYYMAPLVWETANGVTETHHLPAGEDYYAVCGQDLREVGWGSGFTQDTSWVTCKSCRRLLASSSGKP